MAAILAVASGLYAIARMLRRVDDGDYPDLAEPPVWHAHGVLAS